MSYYKSRQDFYYWSAAKNEASCTENNYKLFKKYPNDKIEKQN